MPKLFTIDDMEKAFKAGQETIWEDLEQTARCAKFDSFLEWFEQSKFKDMGVENDSEKL